jgi:hypothetical protein
MIGSVFGSPGVKPPEGVEGGADELGGGVGLAGGVGEGVGLGEGDGGAVLAHTFSESGPVNPLAVALSRKRTSVSGVSLLTV